MLLHIRLAGLDGVLPGCCGAGTAMVPTSWVTMQCPETQAVEKRKVAKLESLVAA